jgi:PleD family two-component response regulator
VSINNEKKKILLVDSNKIQQLTARSILNKRYETIAVDSGKDALNLLIKGDIPDVMLLDISVPKNDGWGIFKNIKGICLLQDIPIVFSSPLDGFLETMYASSIGVSDLISKPFKENELLLKIETAMEENQSQLA